MEPSKRFGYGPHGLTGLYIGAAMPDAQREVLFRVLLHAPPTFYVMRRDKRGFRLHSEKVTYTPPPTESDKDK